VRVQRTGISNSHGCSSSATPRPTEEPTTIDGRGEKLAILNNVSSSQRRRRLPRRLYTGGVQSEKNSDPLYWV